MAMFGQISQPGPLTGLLQSYVRELRGWVGSVTVRYGIAVFLLLAGGAGFIAAIAVSIAGLFHWLDTTYGTTVAYAIVIGALFLLGLASALTAIMMLRQPLPAVPRPHRHAATAGRSVAAKAMMAASIPHKSLMKADPVTEVMIGLAAACLMGWLVSSRMRSERK
jgi:hypothetical protein